jgi:hypothetical protein
VDSWKKLIIILRGHEMLKIIDLGCNKHNRRQFSLEGVGAEIMGDILSNLPKDRDSHTFVCEYGHTHCISFNIQEEKLFRLSAMFSGKGGRFGRRNQNRPMQTGRIPTTL